MDFYLTIGGRREDSRNFSLVAGSSRRQDNLLRNIEAKINKTTEGVHIDWNYPGDACSLPTSVSSFSELLRKLHRANITVMISVPPDESRFRFYDLTNTANIVRFVIVKTHTLVMPGIVACNGDRVSATKIFNKIVEPMNVTLRHKFGYSMSVSEHSSYLSSIVVLGCLTTLK
ncbi:hypothetical protein MTO96_036935 [Rhipicephalus appendiculatus]